jgi:hypothetical protein
MEAMWVDPGRGAPTESGALLFLLDHPILDLEPPVSHLCQFFVVGSDHKCLTHFVSQGEKELVQLKRIL